MRWIGPVLGASESKDFFFEKKKQKTFDCLGCASPDRAGPDS
jgi:hypothetical protein